MFKIVVFVLFVHRKNMDRQCVRTYVFLLVIFTRDGNPAKGGGRYGEEFEKMTLVLLFPLPLP